MTAPLLQVEGLTVGFPTRGDAVAMASNDVSFEVRAGQTLGLVGESGCGKSVTLRAIIRLVQYPGQVLGGAVHLRGRNLLELDHAEIEAVRGEEISMIFQDPATCLNPLFRVGGQVTEVLRVKRGLNGREAEEEAHELLDRVGIRAARARMRDYPHQLSGGMRQRVMIAMAVATRPKLLLADEPTTALDVTIQDQILSLISSLADELEMATILVSHDLGVIAEVCEEVAVMYGGRIVERGPTENVLAHPRHPYTEGLAQAVNELAGARRNGSRVLQTLPGQPPTLSELPEGCSFAPRCRYAQPECEVFDMHLDAPPPSHATACLLRQRTPAR